MTPVIDFFIEELRLRRQAAGMTQEELGKAMAYSGSYVAQIEAGRKPPAPDFARRADEALTTGGLFTRIMERLLVKEVIPEWLKPWFVVEQAATVLRAYNPLVVYGLLQTGDYARALLQSDDLEYTESRVAARMDRQQVFDRDKPPSVVALLDESVLRRRIGTPEIMYDQLIHLTTCSARVQVVPTDAETYVGLDGPFEIAEYDGREVAYIDAPGRGFVLDGVELILKLRERWEALRAEALPQRQSREMILEVAETWKH